MIRATNKRGSGRFNDLRGSRRHASGDQAAGSMAAVMLTLLITTAWGPNVSFAEQPLPQQMAVAYQNGTITGLYETTLQIDHKTYTLASDAILLGRCGEELNVRDLRVDIEVKYHLEKGSTDKIDRMILYLPY